MSLLLDAKAICQGCGTAMPSRLAASVNADRRPDLREGILAGAFQSETCSGCGAELRLPLHLSYIDNRRGQWILAESADMAPDWRTVEAEARSIFNDAHGPDAPPAAQELGRGLVPRIVFGWASLREKLLARDLGLDDVTLELTKAVILREIPDAPLADQNELRLTGADDEQLHLAWIESASETELMGLSIPRDAYDAIDADPEPWTTLRGNFADAYFVDLRRLFLAEPEGQSAMTGGGTSQV
ncbi:MAG TPA: CpXC domain-containing protein [Rhodopila sp.]|uniref:CpXC domain-containing protein n=1 Tax=Rhodopila sp. TaxID=2480087 RepID=UPI002C78CCDB|nr:CpXC domain-containing protein [Rhodopila sp.]HVY14437.1 CpXC domain-containing protein [Rhodopila sp.]